MKSLFKSKNYVWSLFVGHLVIEKLLKALYVQESNSQPYFTHDLLRLASDLDLEISRDQKNSLDTITSFNLRARYDDYKQQFYKRCTKEFATNWIAKIENLRLWIKKSLN